MISYSLDPQQSEAVSWKHDSRLVISAGPGCGKTFVAANRIAAIKQSLRDGDEDKPVICITFTNAAKCAMEETLAELGASGGVEIRTLDSWASQLLISFGIELLDGGENFNKRIVQLTEYLNNSQSQDESRIRIKHLLIDEAQDLIGERLELVKVILDQFEIDGWTVLGDLAQSIYGYLDNDITIERNLLSDAAEPDRNSHTIQLVVDHRAKNDKIRSIRSMGPKLSVADVSESTIEEIWQEFANLRSLNLDSFVVATKVYSNEDCSTGVLVRNNRDVMFISSELAKRGIEHSIATDRLEAVYPAWIADLDGANDMDEAIARCPSFVSTQFLARELRKICIRGKSERITLSNLGERLLNHNAPEFFLRPDPIGVRVSTIHRSKGLEFSRVLLQCSAPEMGVNPKMEADEARVLFVGMTRSSDWLFRLDFSIRNHQQRSKQHNRWVQFEFGRGRRRFATGLEIRTSDMYFVINPVGVSLGDQVFLERKGSWGGTVPKYELVSEFGGQTIATLTSRFSDAVKTEWGESPPSRFDGLWVSGYQTIGVGWNDRDKWGRAALAKAPVIRGMAMKVNNEEG